jgi:phytoene/squalene synthetase
MTTAEVYVRELEEKNQNQIKKLLAHYGDILAKEDLSPADVLRLEQKTCIEAIEVSALWLADTDELELKLQLATVCGEGARHIAAMAERLEALGLPPGTYDPRFGGYSKLFAFMRSLQTTEERVSSASLTLRQLTTQRLSLLAAHCEGKGDPETARLLRDVLLPDEDRHVQIGRGILVRVATAEESQARARRAGFRTLELLAEVFDASTMRKFLSRSLKK